MSEQRTILVIDDCQPTCRYLQRFLEKKGHRVVIATHGEGEQVEIAWRGEALEIAPRSGEGWQVEEVRPGLRRAGLDASGPVELVAGDGSFRLFEAEEV